MKAPACLSLFGAEDKHQARSNESYFLLFLLRGVSALFALGLRAVILYFLRP